METGGEGEGRQTLVFQGHSLVLDLEGLCEGVWRPRASMGMGTVNPPGGWEGRGKAWGYIWRAPGGLGT